MFACPNFFYYCKSLLVVVTVAERGQVGKGVEESHATMAIFVWDSLKLLSQLESQLQFLMMMIAFIITLGEIT